MSSRKMSRLQNRVAPDGSLHAVSARGLLMGNRGGRLHDEYKKLGRARWKSKAWICCVLEFKGRRRAVMDNGYTELFFLDEVTALAAGHRPCFECRRADATAFAACWSDAFGLDDPPKAPQMDAALHSDRLSPPSSAVWSELPDNTMVRTGKEFLIKQNTSAHLWNFDGYREVQAPPGATRVQVVTPCAIVAVLRAGYRPGLHPTATAC